MKIDHRVMVVALNGRKMVVLRNEGDARYPALEVVLHREAETPRTADQGKARPGQTTATAGTRPSALEGNDLHEEEEVKFVSAATESLSRSGTSTDAKIILLADPKSLGRFRKFCDDHLAGRIIAEIPQNVAHRTTDAIAKTVDVFEQE